MITTLPRIPISARFYFGEGIDLLLRDYFISNYCSIERLSNNNSYFHRNFIFVNPIRAVTKLPDSEYIPRIKSLLTSSAYSHFSKFIKTDIIHVISKLNQAQLLDALCNTLSWEEDDEVQSEIFLRLSEIDDYILPTDILLDRAENDPSNRVRSSAVYALRNQLNEEIVLKTLLKILRNDSEVYVRTTCVYSLAPRINDIDVNDIIVHRLETDPSSVVRYTIAKQLITGQEELAKNSLINLLSDDKTLFWDYEDHPEYLYNYVANTLLNIGDERGLIAILKSPHKFHPYDDLFPIRRVKDEAANILQEIGTPEALQSVKAWSESLGWDGN
jgi:HEAT repeat protein